MPSQYLHSGEPLPLAPSLEAGDDDSNVVELNVFHGKLLDYLRRLTAKLSAEEFQPPAASGNLSLIALTLDGDTSQLNTGAFRDVVWDKQIRVDSDFTHTSGQAAFTHVTAGFFILTFDWFMGSAAQDARVIDGDDTVLPYSLHDINGILITSQSMTVPYTAHAGQTIRVQIQPGTSSAVEEDKTRLVVVKVGDFTPTGGIDPCDLDIWQLCP